MPPVLVRVFYLLLIRSVFFVLSMWMMVVSAWLSEVVTSPSFVLGTMKVLLWWLLLQFEL